MIPHAEIMRGKTFLHFAAMNESLHNQFYMHLPKLVISFKLDYEVVNHKGEYFEDCFLPGSHFREGMKKFRLQQAQSKLEKELALKKKAKNNKKNQKKKAKAETDTSINDDAN